MYISYSPGVAVQIPETQLPLQIGVRIFLGKSICSVDVQGSHTE